MEKMEKSVNKRIIVIFMLSLIVIALSTFSYAFFYSIDNTEENIATTDCFKLEFEDRDEIDIDKGYPLSEEEGSLLKPYQFTIRNICNAIEEYQINIETLNNSTIETSNIRYKLDSRLSQNLGEQEKVLEYVNENIKESRKIETGELQKNEVKTYNLRLWIDEESTTDETANKVYKSKVVIKAVPSVDITLNTFGGDISQSVIRRTIGRPIGQIEEPVRAGYQFLGWYYDSKFTKKVKEEDIVDSKTNNIYAKYLANTDTRYTVEHYQMDTNGNYPENPTETENLFGTTDTLVTPEVKSYTGFISPSAEVVNIDGDGSRVVKYYYERQKYTQTTQGRYMDSSGAYGAYSDIDTKDVYYGASYSYSKAQTAEYNAASVAAYTVTGDKTNSIDISRRQYAQTTQGRYMDSSGAYGAYSDIDTTDVYYGASYSYSTSQTVEYNAASVAAYTVTGDKTNSIDISRRTYTQTTQGRYMDSSGAYGAYSDIDTTDVYYGASYSYSKAETVEYNAASVAAYTVTGDKTNSIDISRRQYAQTTQGRYMNTSGAYGNYSTLETKNVYYGASYSYSTSQTVEYNAASVTAYTVTGEKTNSIDISRRTYAQTTQGRYMNTSGAYGSYSTLETKNVYYGASYSYSKAATAEYAAASVAAYTVTAAKTNQVSFARRQYTQTTQGRYMNTSGTYGNYSNLESKNVYYGAKYSYSKAATAEYAAASVAAYTVTAAKTNQISFARNKYSLVVKPNGGTWSGSTSNQTFTQYYGTTKALANPSASYAVAYNANGQGASYTASPTAASRPFSSWTKTGSTWSGNTFTFHGAGTATANYNGTASAIALPAISKSNAFCYWRQGSASGTVRSGGQSLSLTGATTFYAKCNAASIVNAAGTQYWSRNCALCTEYSDSVRRIYKKYSGVAYAAQCYTSSGPWYGPILVSTVANNVAYYTSWTNKNSPSMVLTYAGTISYGGVTWYYSQNEHWVADGWSNGYGSGYTKYTTSASVNGQAAAKACATSLLAALYK